MTRLKLVAITMVVTGLMAAPQVASALRFAPATGSPLTLAAGAPVNMSTTGDFNGDGRDDIAAVTNANALHIWLSQADGTFTNPPGSPFAENSLLGAPRTILAADFDDDGEVDLAIGFNAFFDVYFGAGDGTFGESGDTHFQVPATTPGNRTTADDFSNALGDVNNDGNVDIVFGMAETGLGVMLNDGSGTFTAAPGGLTYFFPPAERADLARSYSPALGDWDGDGDLDVAVALGGGGSGSPTGIYVADGNGTGTFTPDGQPLMAGTSFMSLATLDLNGDIYEDLAAAKFTTDDSKNIFTLVGASGGLAVNPNANGSIYAGSWPYRMAAVDLDDRHLPDLAVGNPYRAEIAGLHNPGDGTLSTFSGSPFAVPQIAATNAAPRSVYSGDFNGDGAPDLATDSPYNNAGQAKGIAVLINQPDAAGPASVDFGGVIPPATSYESVQITNSGAAPAEPSSVPEITGPDSDQFTLGATTCGGGQLDGNDDCSQGITFTPTSLGEKTANLVYEMSNQDDVVVPLTGSGVDPELTVPDGTQYFGDTFTGQSNTRTFTLESTGTGPVEIDGATIESDPPNGSDDFSITGDGCDGETLIPEETCQIAITFAPSATGIRSASIEVPSTDPADGGTRTFQIDGTGVDREITVSPATQEFGDVVLADPPSDRPTRTLTITSSGTTPATVTDMTIDGVDDGDFKLTDPSCGTLAPAATCEVQITFNPTGGESRPRTANLVVESDGRGGDTTTPLRGTVVDKIDPPPGPRLTLSLKAPRGAKAGKALPVKATVKNTGGATATAIALKTAVPRKSAKAPKAIRIPSLAAGKSITKTIKVKVKKSARKGKLTVKVTATANKAAKITAKRTVQLR
ncbi:MAG TPA: choice-of-anchor D domain-containing protein [Solirubrobacterales bacterium]|nr:choice-of-anchor D domain-containing protein [Solirubrobacterales bacterium]